MVRVARLLLPWSLALVASGCGIHVDYHSVDLAEYDFERVHVMTAAGTVEVLAGEEAAVDATLRYLSDEPPTLRIEVVDGVLEIEEQCGLGYGLCTIDVDAVLPADMPLEVSSSSGAVAVQGRVAELAVTTVSGAIDVAHHTGAVELESSTGAIDLENVAGDVTARNTSGKIDGAAIDAAQVEVHTTSGLTALQLLAPPDRVTVGSVSGGVDLGLPVESYDLELTSDSGGITVIGLEDVDGAERLISIHTASGGISVIGD